MRGTALIYSSHDRGQTIHNDYIVQRALHGGGNRRILFLPMSEPPKGHDERDRQEYGWGNFRWFFDFYRQHGLEYMPFYWSSSLSKHDVDQLWEHLWSSEVVILGGGNSKTGMWRYKHLGERFDGEWGKFGRILHERQARGMLTVGYSAGADQLCQYLFSRVHGGGNTDGFGLVRNALTSLHHDASRNGALRYAAQSLPHCMAFGLPNDAGLNVDQGVLPSGNHWQVIEFIVDRSWHHAKDEHHVRTRHGSLIEHFYCDGRHWSFHNGDKLVRVQSSDNRFHEAWMTSHGRLHHYWSQHPSGYHRIEDILASH